MKYSIGVTALKGREGDTMAQARAAAGEPPPGRASSPGTPEILSPRWRRGARADGGLVRNENLDFLSHLLDDFLRVPGTNIRFGLDGIVGVIPGIGDILGGLASTIIILAAWARGVPKIVLARMVANVGIEVLVGTIPLLGDAFDIAWKANRRNYALLTGSLEEPARTRKRSWIFFLVICVTLLVLMLIPLVLVSWLTAHFVVAMRGR